MLTAYELLNRRFGPHAKHFAASLFLIMRALAEGVRVFAASLVLAAVLERQRAGPAASVALVDRRSSAC